jgi:hypothetical protein
LGVVGAAPGVGDIVNGFGSAPTGVITGSKLRVTSVAVAPFAMSRVTYNKPGTGSFEFGTTWGGAATSELAVMSAAGVPSDVL